MLTECADLKQVRIRVHPSRSPFPSPIYAVVNESSYNLPRPVCNMACANSAHLTSIAGPPEDYPFMFHHNRPLQDDDRFSLEKRRWLSAVTFYEVHFNWPVTITSDLAGVYRCSFEGIQQAFRLEVGGRLA